MYDTYCTRRYIIYHRGLLLLITSVRKYNYKRKTTLADLLKSKNKLIYSPLLAFKLLSILHVFNSIVC